MTDQERSATTQLSKARAFAALQVLLRAPGTAVLSPARSRALGTSVLLALLSTLLFVSTASADSRIGEEGAAAGQLRLPQGIAVSSREAGDIYVIDSANQRIDQFDPTQPPGEQFVRAFGWDVNASTPEEKLQTCTTATGCQAGQEGSGPGQLRWPDEIAVDNSCAEQEPPLSGAACEAFDPSYGDVYVTDTRNLRVEKYDPEGEFLLMFGGEVDQGPHHPGNLCTAQYIAEGDACGAGVPGTGAAHFYVESPGTGAFGGPYLYWGSPGLAEGVNAIAVGPDGSVYVGDYGRIQQFEPSGAFVGEITAPYPQLIGSLVVDATGRPYALFSAIDEEQKLTPPVSGTYELCFQGECTEPIQYNAEYSTVSTELANLTTIGFGNIEVNPRRGGWFRTVFRGALGHTNVPQITVSGGGSTETLLDGATAKVAKLGPSGEVLQSFDTETGSEPTHIALDQSGDLFVSDRNGGEFQFRAFKPNGVIYAVFNSDQVGFPPGGIAVGADSLYATSGSPGGAHVAVHALPVAGPPSVTEEQVADIEPTTATLSAVVNPEQFDTTYQFQYITQRQYEEDGDSFGAGTVKTPEPPEDLGSVSRKDPVSAGISDLTPETAYRFRVLAENDCNGPSEPPCVTAPDETFETLPDVSVRNFTTERVAPEEVILKAELNNNNSLAPGHYAICYGPAPGNYTGGCSEGTLPAGSGDFKAVQATFTGLSPNTTYHYRLTAHNSYPGEVETPDAEFTTEETLADQDAREGCSNTLLREENGSLALPDCRAYEQVSPPYKAGYPAAGDWLAPSGDSVLYNSVGAFAGAVINTPPLSTQYVARRTETGWITQAAVQRPAGPGFEPGVATDFSPELDRWVFAELPGLSVEEARNFSTTGSLWMRLADGTFNRASPTISLIEGAPRYPTYLEPIGQSEDLSHLFIVTSSRLLPAPSDERPDTYSGEPDRIYEVAGADGENPTIGLVAEVPLGLIPGNTARCFINAPYGLRSRLASADGSVLFYSVPIEEAPGANCGEGMPNPIGLFARTAEPGQPATTVQLNSPWSCTSGHPCDTAAPTTPLYVGASPDGSRAWFTTSQPLVDSDTDQTGDLYLAKLENGHLLELVQASAGEAALTHPIPGQGAGVQGVVRISQDGSHTYFVATGVLTEHENALHQKAEAGADNLYAYDAVTAQLEFVATLPAADSAVWSNGNASPTRAKTTPDGRYLLFTSFGRITPDDSDNVQDLYRYDFQTGQLVRLSFGRNGNDGNGNDPAYPVDIEESSGRSAAELTEDFGRSITADGSTVIFETAAPLVSPDTNHAIDVYEWEEDGHGACDTVGGCISLVSDGLDPHGTHGGAISLSGRDIAFFTQRGEVPADTDGVGDVYDARVNGGFPYSPPQPPCGGAEVCHGEGTHPAPPPNFTTEGLIGPGNQPEKLHCGKGRHRVKRNGKYRCVPNHKRHHRRHKRHHKHSRSHGRANTNRGGGK